MRSILFLFLSILVPITLVAQEQVTLSGIIYDQDTGETLMGINISIPGTNSGTVSNQYGFYSITLPKNTYDIEVSSIGFKMQMIRLTLDKNLKKDIFLLPATENLGEVVIPARDHGTPIRSSQMSVNTLSSETIKKIPVVLGEVDVIKSLTLLPGVSSAGEGSGGFNVRGGAVDQNLILLDEAILYDSSHLFGFFSVFNPDAIKNLTLYKGAIPARYGGRLASVLEIQQKDGNTKSYKASGGIGLISSRLLLEGPIVKDKSFFLLAGRSSYAHLFLPLFDMDNKAFFYDLNSKISYNIDKNNRLFLSGYFGRDVFKISESFSNSFGNATLNLRWNRTFKDRLFSNLSLIFSDYHYSLDLNLVGFEYQSGIRNWNLKYDFTDYLQQHITLRYGVNSIYYQFNPGEIKPIGNASGIHPLKLTNKAAVENAIYGEVETELNDHISIQAGLRLSSFNRLGQNQIFVYENDQPLHFNEKFRIYEENDPIDTISVSSWKSLKHFFIPEPRFGISFIIDDYQSIKAGYTRMTQSIHLISNTSSPTPLDVYAPSGKYIEPQKSHQYTIGYFRNWEGYALEAESFYKSIKNRLDYIPGADLIANNAIERVLLKGSSRAYGVELLLRKNLGRLRGWLSYTLSRSEQQTPGRTEAEDGINFGNWYLTPWDKTHDLSVTAQYELSKNWELGANLIFQTGRPTTYPEGQYIYEGMVIPVFELRNSSRLPNYHRMDLSATFTPAKTNKRFKSQWVFSIYNVYNRKNAASISFKENKDTQNNEAVRLSIFGIIPSVTYNFNF